MTDYIGIETPYTRFEYFKERFTRDQKRAVELVLNIPAKEAADMKDLDLHTYTVVVKWLEDFTVGWAPIFKNTFKHRVKGLPEKHDNITTRYNYHLLTWKDGITTCSVKECEVNGG